MFERILVPLDGSDLAEDVLPCIESLVRRLSARIHFVVVVPVGPPLFVAASAGRDFSNRLLVAELRAAARAVSPQLSRLVEECRARGVEASGEVVYGEAARCIVRSAQRHGVGLIAMSSRGRVGVGRLLLGSVAERVVREAGVPVLLVGPRVVPALTLVTSCEQAVEGRR